VPVKAGRRSTSWDSLALSFRVLQAVCSSLPSTAGRPARFERVTFAFAGQLSLRPGWRAEESSMASTALSSVLEFARSG
jgi:hypothetical protein